MLFPKPPKRQKRPPRPLRRTKRLSPSKKRLKRYKRIRRATRQDAASFRHRDIFTVWGPRIICALTGANEYELHHILGRGYEFGAKQNNEDRILFSSPFNSLPLVHAKHAAPKIHSRNTRLFFLDLAYNAVMKAVDEGFYEITDNDRRFLFKIVGPWKATLSPATL